MGQFSFFTGSYCVIILTMNESRVIRKPNKSYGRRALRIIALSILIMMIVAIGSAIVYNSLRNRMPRIIQSEATEYSGHYAFIVEGEDEDFWKSVYYAACDEAVKEDIYIEDLRESLGVNYSDTDLLRVAVNSSVDGIIYGGSINEKAGELIDRAVSEGIGVVLLQNDIEASGRQCFVGVNNYELGQMYASQIAEIMSLKNDGTAKSVDILVDMNAGESMTNVITMAIEDYFSENYPDYPIPVFNIRAINMDDSFSVEEDIRKLFLDEENLPDIMMCLSSICTRCAYQAVVDQNKVGDVEIIGFFAGSSILDAVNKQIIYSTISVDTWEMGRYSVQALNEYRESGYTNSYMPVSTQVIGLREAGKLLAIGEGTS